MATQQRDEYWINNDGLKVGFGPRTTDNPESGPIKTEGLRKQIIKRIYDASIDAPATDTAPVEGDQVPIPANAVGIRAWLRVTEAFVGSGATLNIGVKEADGTTIDVDGLIAAPVADLGAGEVVVGTGDLIDAVIATVPAYITVTASGGAFTAGAGELTVEYLLDA